MGRQAVHREDESAYSRTQGTVISCTGLTALLSLK